MDTAYKNKIKKRYFIQDYSVWCALGSEKAQIFKNWMSANLDNIQFTDKYSLNKACHVAIVNQLLPNIPAAQQHFSCRNNQLLLAAYESISQSVAAAIKTYGRERIGVVIGTSTSGTATGETAFAQYLRESEFSPTYHFNQQKIGSGAEFLKCCIGLDGPAFTVSTACSSGANALMSAQRLLMLDLCDSVIVGAADTLCNMTVQGFFSLESISRSLCQPFSVNRQGITIGEGAALFLLSKKPADIELYGIGCTADAHHISAPDPSGRGAMEAMRKALAQSPFSYQDVDYLNLHGTATKLNDAMESKAVNSIFGTDIWCSSTKSLTGHTLGAAAAVELALCCLLISAVNEQQLIPAQHWDGCFDPELLPIKIVSQHCQPNKLKLCLSNSFAFGGNNASLLIGHAYESF